VGLRDMLKRSAKAVIGEVVDRVLERGSAPPPAPRQDQRWPEARATASPATTPRRAAERPGASPATPPRRAAERPGAPVDEPTREPPAREPTREPPVEPPDQDEPPVKDPPTRKAPVEPPPNDEPPVEEPPRRDPADATADPPDEPILTRTMAGLLAAQGYHERALRIYDHLVGSEPGDRDLAAEADTVRARMEDEEEIPEDEVAAVPVRRDALLVSWKVTDRSVDRARRVLGTGGRLTARVVIVARHARDGVSSSTLERPDVDATGEHVFAGVPRGARCTASVGLQNDDRFVSVAHSRVVPT